MVEPLLDARIRAARVVILSANKLTIQLVRSQLPPIASLTICEDGGQAKAALSTRVFDLAVVDVDPAAAFDGLGLIETLRNLPDPKRAGLPVILLVVNPTKEQVERARKAGILQIVLKPFSTATLLSHVKSALGEAVKHTASKPAEDPPAPNDSSDPDWMV